VPASQIIKIPSMRSSTQGVFPPYLRVLNPGVGIEPRVPQNFT